MLREPRTADLGLYTRLYTEPVMWTHLGGVPEIDIAEKLAQDIDGTVADERWVCVFGTPEDPETGVGAISLWRHDEDGTAISEIGWMALPEQQGRGLTSTALGEVLARADADGRWGAIHAFPGVANPPSNALCQRHGFVLEGAIDLTYRGAPLRVNRWVRPAPGPR